MEESQREAPAADGWRESFAQTIDQMRCRSSERFAGQRERLRDLDAKMAAQLDEAKDALSRLDEQSRQADSQSETKAAALQERQTLLEQRQKQLDARQVELDKLQAEIAGSKAAEAERANEFKRRETELAAARKALDDERGQVKAQLEAASEREANVKFKEKTLEAREAETRRQRQAAAQQLRARKNELAAEAELIRASAASTGAEQDMQLQLRVSELQGKCDQLREELDAREKQRDDATKRLAESKAQLDAKQRELDKQQATVEQSQKKQQELETERSRLHADLQRHFEESRRQADAAREELVRHASELDRVRRESAAQIERIRAEIGGVHNEQQQSLRQQLADARAKLAEKEAAWDQARGDLVKELAAARTAGGGSQASAAELAKMRDENKQLEAWLAEAEQKAKQSGSGGSQEMDDLRRRFEMAVQDVRELKTKNAELTEQLSKRQSTGASAGGGLAAGGWESLKQKLMADLETDFDEGDATQKSDKLTVQGTIKITDEVVAAKEREIEELRQLLESQTQQVGEVAVGAAAVAQMLDSDELVCQERESLKRLQDSLREQLRQAEVDISLERAKLARERSELDEKIRGIEAEKANLPPGGSSDHSHDKGKKQGRKWLTQLGLGSAKEE